MYTYDYLNRTEEYLYSVCIKLSVALSGVDII